MEPCQGLLALSAWGWGEAKKEDMQQWIEHKPSLNSVTSVRVTFSRCSSFLTCVSVGLHTMHRKTEGTKCYA